MLTFQRSGFFDEEEVAAGRERILAFYQQRGYYLAEVDAKADYEAGQVVYSVRENNPVPVAEVRLVGFTHFGEGWVRQQLETRASSGEEPHLLQTPLARARPAQDPVLVLRRRFHPGGGPAARGLARGGPAGAVVIYSVREGPRTLLRSVSFAGAVALSRAQLPAAARFQEGAPFRDADLQPAVDRVRAAYARAGYPQCVVTARPDFGADRSRVDVRFTVDEGRLQRLGSVVVTGNGRTNRRVILRELPLKPGEPLDPEALAKGKSELYDLGLFREVRYFQPEPVAPGGPQDVVLAVRERPTGFVGFGVGYSSDERFRGFVEAGEQNLFGTGRGLRWKSKVSEIGYRHDLFYLEPWLFNYRLKGQADLYLESQEETGYKVRREGLAFGVNREFTPQLLLNLRYRYELVDYSNVDPDLTAELGPLESFNIGSVGLVVDYDRRDNPISPRRGSNQLASVEVARPLFGGDASFTKYQLESVWYLRSGPAPRSPSGCAAGSRKCSSAPGICRSPSASSSAATAACAATATRRSGRRTTPATRWAGTLRPGERRVAVQSLQEAPRRALPRCRGTLGGPGRTAGLGDQDLGRDRHAVRDARRTDPPRLGIQAQPRARRVALPLAPDDRLPVLEPRGD